MPLSDRSRRLVQIDKELNELIDLSQTQGLNQIQKSNIATGIKALLEEKQNLQENHDHWLADTKPSMKSVNDAMVKEFTNANRTKTISTGS